MTHYGKTLLKLLTMYKRLLKRYTTEANRKNIINHLGLKRTLLRHATTPELFRKAEAVEQALAQQITNWHSCKGNEYCGLEAYHSHLREFMVNHHIDGKRIRPKANDASQAMLEAVQLAGLPEHRLTEEIALKLKACIKKLRMHGHKDHHQLVIKTLHQHKPRKPIFFESLIQIQAA